MDQGLRCVKEDQQHHHVSGTVARPHCHSCLRSNGPASDINTTPGMFLSMIPESSEMLQVHGQQLDWPLANFKSR